LTATESQTALEDWRLRIGRRRAGAADRAPVKLPAPPTVTATAGRGQVTVDWAEVPGAAGYVVLRSSTPGGPFRPVDHGGLDVLAVPFGAYADTTEGNSASAWYCVAAVVDVDTAGESSSPVAPVPVTEPGIVQVRVRAEVARRLPRPWRPMIGSEHLSYMLNSERTGGRVIGEDLTEALLIVRDVVGVESVRAHAILSDDLAVYREVGGLPVHDFTGVDRVYDRLRSLDLRPVVELSFMPSDLASDPDSTVFDYRAITSPPKDWDRWSALVRDLTSHLVDRYGLEEVRQWSFEVWNEPNLEVFWSGTPEEYFRLFDVTVAAVRAVDRQLLVGGPSTAAAGWIDDLLTHVDSSGAPIDFISTHVYGNAPLDYRPVLERHGRGDVRIWWTEWGPTPTHFNTIGDSVQGAGFLLRGMKSAAGRVDALSHWVASDHFEELGRPPTLSHGGFGLLTVGNLRKPRFWALQLLAELGDHERAVEVTGDGANSLVEAMAAHDEDGRLSVIVWNATLDQTNMTGRTSLDRHVELHVAGLRQGRYLLRHRRIDASHSDIITVWERIRAGADWPTDAQWEQLAAANTLDDLEPPRPIEIIDGSYRLAFDLPMPGVSALEFVPGN
jgi:xylan 1,4-beta-xylosidase